MKSIFLLLFLAILINTTAQNKKNVYYKEKYRPQFHFTPAINWTNDPNGLVYYSGEYHLFYQHNPFGNSWGHMSWGHAVSKDLVHWQHLPVAIPEENGVMIFSGSVVIDEHNTAGFAEKPDQVPMVAVYTGHLIPNKSNPDDYRQSQHIAYSLDKGRTWKKYSGNPVLDLHKKDFRDPNVFWYGPGKKWVMAVVLPHEHIVQFYSSPNLKQWTHLSDFGPAGDINDIWECPALTRVPVENSPGATKWVLFNSQQTTMQYFVGEFDGTRFANEDPPTKIFRPDYGPDYYAAITYNHLPAHQMPVILGWANNWKYANDIPTYPWKSAMSLPRELSLRKINNEWILVQQPVLSIQGLRTNTVELKNILVTDKKTLPVRSQQLEIEILIKPTPGVISGVRLAVGKQNAFVIGYDGDSGKLFIDRSACGNNSFNKNFAALSRYAASLSSVKRSINLHIYFDKSIVEVFANDGTVVMTAQCFVDENDNGVELFSDGGKTVFESVKIRQIKSAWN